MPAGSYKIIESNIAESILQIQSSDGAQSVFVDIIPTHSAQPRPETDVTFHKDGDAEYLNRIWIEGQEYGMKVIPLRTK
jgi:hypothetical protein